jgi:AcrR family transcriptional regulator
MQFKKEQVRDSIVAAARREFLEKGYEKASIRSIMATANTSKSNVYNYFKDKDALFITVVGGTLSKIDAGIERLRAIHMGEGMRAYTVEAQERVLGKVIEFVFEHHDDLTLLMFYSAVSSQAGFLESATGKMAGVLGDWMRYFLPERNLSEFFVEMVAGFYVGSVAQMLARDVSMQQATTHMSEFLRFIHGGWSAVLDNSSGDVQV